MDAEDRDNAAALLVRRSLALARFVPGARKVAEYLALSTKTLYGWRCRKYGPPSYRLGNNVRYRPEELRAWVDAQNALAA